MRKEYKKNIYLALILTALYALLFCGLIGYTKYVNSREYVLELGTEGEDYRFTEKTSKRWEESSITYRFGMQCDFEVENYTKSKISNWYAEVLLLDKCRIDSSWNGEFILNDNLLTVSPVDYNDTVDPGDMQPFGMILYGPEKSCIVDARIVYHLDKKVTECIMFYVLIVLALSTLITGIVGGVFATKKAVLEKKNAESVKIINQSLVTFANMIDAKDSYTKGHSQRVAHYAREIYKRMGASEEEQTNIFYVGLLHDIGKIGVQDAILKKTTKLNYDEFNEIKEHVSIGGDILKNFTAIKGIEDGARYHHEKYDGTGYMRGLSHEEIPLIARIICVADAFDAMSSARCYRETPLSREKIIEEFNKYSGTQFDPELVPYILEMINEGVVPIEISDSQLTEELL